MLNGVWHFARGMLNCETFVYLAELFFCFWQWTDTMHWQ